ncbi:pentapeptide repeat-containing protein [Candidatus Albibeggiatoa sp. nov. NOAA]|uniref:pentapeptide repeat-containing protein n=1 Tax=Candidatus Albibeggiatoa sp. nov. NOAA TaxID=3162724 RepID=UPI0032FCC94B|nr:pentapeptide repeat-containing protein [Thiotrichaceae bacterium]
MFRLALLLLLTLTTTSSYTQETKLLPEVLIEKCGSPPPYYDYKFNQEEIDALLKQWIPLHQEWSSNIYSIIHNKNSAEEKFTVIHRSIYAKDSRKINLCGANLTGLDLTGVDLSRANLTDAILYQANLTDTRLVQVNFTSAYLRQTNLTDAYLEYANFTNVDLVQANLSGAYLFYTNFTSAKLYETNLTDASVYDANFSNAGMGATNLTDAFLQKIDSTGSYLEDSNFTGADLSQANLSDVLSLKLNLTKADLTKTNLSNIKLHETNFNQSIFHPDSKLISNIDISEFSSKVLRKQDKFFGHVNYYHEKAQEIAPAMVVLRNEYKKAGMRESERIVTNLIQTRIEQANIENEKDVWKQLEGWLSKIFFNWTTAYGLEPQRALNILVFLVGFFAFIYWLALRFDSKHNQFEIIWESKPQTCNSRRGIKAGKQNQDICIPLRLKRTKIGWLSWLWFELKILRIAIYFSFLSAFTIGWRQYNIGNWVRQLQTRDITLRIRKGWIRSVSGFQALMGLYLLVIWMLTQFGRPFE